MGGQGFDGGVQSRVGEDPPSPPTRENPRTIGSFHFSELNLVLPWDVRNF